MDLRSSVLWAVALSGSLVLSVRVMEDQQDAGFEQTDAPIEAQARWQNPVPDLQAIHLDPGLEALLQRVDADPRLVAVLLDSARTARIQADCPPRLPELIILCEPDTLAPLVEEVEQVLLDALGDPEDAIALWAVELLVARGERGADIAHRALVAEDAHYRLARQQTLAVHVLARTLPAPESVLRQALNLSAPVAAMAALELARLGVVDARVDITKTQARLSNTAEGLLVSHAVNLIDQTPSSP